MNWFQEYLKMKARHDEVLEKSWSVMSELSKENERLEIRAKSGRGGNISMKDHIEMIDDRLPDLSIYVDFFRPSGKWYAGGEVNVGSARLWEGRGRFLAAVWAQQRIISAPNGGDPYWTVVTRNTTRNDEDPNYHEHCLAVLQVGVEQP